MLPDYYIINLPVNYYEQPPAYIPVDYYIKYSSFLVRINNLAIVWPPCVPLAETVRAWDQLHLLCHLSLLPWAKRK